MLQVMLADMSKNDWLYVTCLQAATAAAAHLQQRQMLAKVTDTQQYTGIHRHRFDPATGQGRGLAGRDSIPKGEGSAAGRYPPPVSSLLLYC